MNLALKTFKRHHLWKTLFVVCFILLVGSFFTDNYSFLKTGSFAAIPSFNEEAEAKLDFYVMSQCPYGTQVEVAVAPILKKFGSAVNFNIYFIGMEQEGQFMSLHGQAEVNENMRQLCIQKHFPEGLVDYLSCQNKDIMSADKNWERCAGQNDIDVKLIKDCFNTGEGYNLLRESFKASEEIGALGSPTIYLNGELYNGGRTPESFQIALCQNLKSNPACADVPECGSPVDCEMREGKISDCDNGKCSYRDPVHVEVTILNDEKCSTCDTSQIVAATRNFFPGVEFVNVDVNTEEGKALIEKYGVEVVPAYFFTQNIEETELWPDPGMQSAFEKTLDGYKLSDATTGASRYVNEEKRQEFLESIGVQLGDNKPQIDFYVMSYCPFGNIAEEGIEPVYQLLKDKADFNPHYVVYSNYQGGGPQFCMDEESKLCSMHGVQEMNQGIRELCVAEELGMDEYFEFVLAMNKECSYTNADVCWTGVAENLGLDTAKIEKCFEERGEALGLAELELNHLLGVRGSPAVFIDGEAYKGGRSPEEYKNGLCAAFEDAPPECGQVLTAESAGPDGSC
ncbi:MAG: hypothetical protein U9Q69_03975 [Nanoarchaeota archaeon]|nr:hypothetical protein [Nanoarchaeota archaeon]